MWAKGDKFYAIWSGRPVPETYRVCPMNINEDKVAEEMIPELTAGGYLLGDGEYDANPVLAVHSTRWLRMCHPGGGAYTTRRDSFSVLPTFKDSVMTGSNAMRIANRAQKV